MAVWNTELGVWEGNKAARHQEDCKLPSPLWIFGYGSLCWKPDGIKYAEKRVAVLSGWKRRFHQKS